MNKHSLLICQILNGFSLWPFHLSLGSLLPPSSYLASLYSHLLSFYHPVSLFSVRLCWSSHCGHFVCVRLLLCLSNSLICPHLVSLSLSLFRNTFTILLCGCLKFYCDLPSTCRNVAIFCWSFQFFLLYLCPCLWDLPSVCGEAEPFWEPCSFIYNADWTSS